MKSKSPIAPRARWRDRFVEIARQVEATSSIAPVKRVAGLRLRARMLSRRLPSAKATGFLPG